MLKPARRWPAACWPDTPPEKVEAVAHAIAAHRFRSGPAPQTLEAKIVHDADKLDAIGAVGVARAFAYGGLNGQRLWAEVPPGYVESERNPAEHTPIHEYKIKLAKIRGRLLTDSGRRLAEERHAFMVAFFERLELEVRGLIHDSTRSIDHQGTTMADWKSSAAVAIIGGGIMGASTAYHLAQRGCTDVVILEKGISWPRHPPG